MSYANDPQKEADFDEDDEMPATERELAEDAQWKVIQKNTFTRWANEHLKTVGKCLNDLEADLCDGLRLIALVEVLSGKKFKHINKRPNFRTQKLENVTLSLKFLEEDEEIKIVNIDSSDIVDHNLKLILGLIWTLILHYSISMPMWEGEDDAPGEAKEKETPKARLLRWIQSKVPDKPINNFTTDWNDGTAIGALVDAVAPGLCPDWEDWEPKNAKKNAQEAMDLAEKWLDVPQLIKPGEMTNPKVDDLSMMTYLSQFPNAKLKPGAPLRPRTNAGRVRAYGPGLENTGNNCGANCRFTVETFSAGRGDVSVTVLNPNGVEDPCEVKFNNDRNLTYTCEYTPTMEGEYRVIIKFAGKEIPKSPYRVVVEGAVGDATKVTAAGPGIEKKGVQATKKTYFEVFAKDAGNGVLECVVVDAAGHKDTIKPKITDRGDGTYLVEYVPKELGQHSVHVSFAGMAIPDSPYGVTVSPPVDPKRCYATGRGVQPKGIRVGDAADFKIHTEGAGQGELIVKVLGPGGVEEKVDVKKIDEETYACVYKPKQVGAYVINVTYSGLHIAKSPFKVQVGAFKESKIRAYGPGLEGGMCGKSADFIVETNGETGALGFQVEGPSQAKIDCKDNGDGSADVSYWPSSPGEYAVHILCNEEDIPNSPFMAQIQPATNEYNPSKVVAKGPGLQKAGVVTGKWAMFTVDATQAGRAPLNITAIDADYNPIPVEVHDNRDGTYGCRYMPKQHVKHTIFISYGGCNVPNSPFRVYVQEPSNPDKVKVYGAGVEKGVKTFQPTEFFVDCKEAGPGDIAIAMTDERGIDVPLQTTMKEDGLFQIAYEPKSVGDYNLAVFFAEKEIPSSPMKVSVEPSIDVSKVTVDGLEENITVGEEFEFDILTQNAGKAQVTITVKSPSGKTIIAALEEMTDGFAARFTPTEPGKHSVHIQFGGQPVPGSPFTTTAIVKEAPIAPKQAAPAESSKPVGNASKVKVYGEGLTKGVTGKAAEFTIDTREAGPGGLGLTLEGPSEAKIECRDNGDGTCLVTYYPTAPGDYKINITFADVHINNSPFTSTVVPGKQIDVSGVKVAGPGIQPKGVFMESSTDFTVDCRTVTPKTVDDKVRAIVTNPSGTKNDTVVTPVDDGMFKVDYTPYEQGPHEIDVTYEGIPIPGSPFPVEVIPGNDPNRVEAFGPGLQGGLTNVPQTFTISTRGAGKGGLGLAMEGPSEAKMTCKDNRDGTCTVEYLPTKPGPYTMNVTFADKPIPGSPFTVPITDEIRPEKCKAYGPGLDDKGVRAGQPATFTVDCREAGEAPLEATFTDDVGNPQPCDVEPVDDNVYNVTYYPATEGACTLAVTYDGKHIPNSPIEQPILPQADASQVKVNGDGIQSGAKASLPVSFTIDTRDAGVGDLDVTIVAPDGSAVLPTVKDNGDGTFTITYVPEDVGRYTIMIKFAGQVVPNAPFNVETVPTGDASKCQITETLQKTVIVGEECVITVDAATAGLGNVTCRIRTPSDTDADIDIVDNGDGTFTIKYTPNVVGAYTINIKFGGQPIPAGTCTQQAVNPEDYVPDEQQLVGEDLIQAEVTDRVDSAPPGGDLFSPVEFALPVGPVFSFVDAEVTMPSGKKNYPKIVDNKDGTVTVQYNPTETGLHELAVRYNNEPIEGSPFKFHVDSVQSGYVTAYGPGLTFGVSGEPANFTVVTKDAGAGGLSLAVEGPSKAEITCIDNKDGSCSVSYLPTSLGEYKVLVKWDGKHIAGSPFAAKITGGGRRRTSFSRGSEFSLKVTETDISDLSATIKAPSGKEDPCILKKLANGHLGISFTPHETGEHLVNVRRNGQHIANSPFKIHVSRNEIGNAGKVKVYGDGLDSGTANKRNTFTVDTREAGYGGLSLSIEGPSKADIECQDNEDGTCLVSYKPTEPGTYIINIKFADDHVPGSPFTVKIGGVSAGHVVEKITRQQECVDVTHAGSHCELALKIPGTDPFDMTASVTNPSGVTELCDIMDLDDCHYSIKFTPVEMGTHTVSVKYKDMHIPGSPFQFTVGPITEGGSHKVHAAGPGLERGEVNEPSEFNIYTREAGAGSLSIGVEGPSKAEIKFEDRKDGSCGVQYTCTEPGEYVVNVKFNDEHIPDSPFHVPVVPSTGDARKVSVQSLQQKGLAVGKPVSFSCVYNGAQGKLSAKVVAPSGAEDTAMIQQIDETEGHYAVRFIPRENGIHYVHVLLDGNHIKGSPFRMLVGKIDADPGMVHARGAGLAQGETNKHNKFIVSTIGAGASTLGVTIDGPSKVELNCKEIPEGYEFDYVPTAPGNYLITVKYGGNTHIVGSPFKAKITGEGTGTGLVEQTQCIVDAVSKTESGLGFQMPKLHSDASKVTAKGNGLQKSFVNKKTSFTVDTRDGGQNMLFVGVIGPAKSAPCDEVNIKHTRAHEYSVSYVVKDKGQYMLVVKWGDEHIPGSPFQVNVL